MSSFLVNAQEIFAVAAQSEEPEDITIHLNSSSYRIKRAQGRVTVEGESGMHRCMIQTVKQFAAKIPDQPRYQIM